MAIEPIRTISGKAVPIMGADVDTDRIIPARFLKCVTFDDLAQGLFYDERFEEDGSSKNHPIDAEQHQQANIMIVGPNFGCGSSREHAPQSIKRAGFDAIIGSTYAEIFFGNSTGLGMPCVSADPQEVEKLAQFVAQNPSTQLHLDLQEGVVNYGPNTLAISMPEGAKEALLSGKFDTIAELLANHMAIDELAKTLPYVQ